jgi:hypothetical protein
MHKKNEETKAGEIKLVVDHFGEFGYDDLVKQYEASTPASRSRSARRRKLDDYRPLLVRYLATNKGAGDVVALEEGIITEFKANPNNWVDLTPYVGDKSADYLPWKYEIGKTADGKLMALPPTSVVWPCATAATCSRPPASRRTATRSASCGRRGTRSSTSRSSIGPRPARACSTR